MYGLIGDRFLKRFIGRCLPRHTANPTGEALSLLEYTAEKPDEQGCPTVEDQLKEKVTPEKNNAGEIPQVQNAHVRSKLTPPQKTTVVASKLE